jgi:hypothetical protein
MSISIFIRHRGSLATRAPVVPSPANAGADGASDPVLATRTAPEFCQAIPKKKKERHCTKHPSPNEQKTASSFVQ